MSKKKISQTEAAKMLGVTREHLNRVIHSHRKSPKLLESYKNLTRRTK